jgi:hypothetical protein
MAKQGTQLNLVVSRILVQQARKELRLCWNEFEAEAVLERIRKDKNVGGSRNPLSL